MTNHKIRAILLQFNAEQNQGLNELAGHGTAIEQAAQQLEDYFLERLDNIEQSIVQHTVPEGKHLVTRSYVRNAIEFERQAIKEGK
jgi:hypothetical protein